MRITLFIIYSFLCLGKAFATGQTPDYLIIGNDTVPIYNNPLEQYFDKVGKKELIDFQNPCWSTACWRGYMAYWELKNDSLFLLRITSCVEHCGDEARDANIFAMFGNNKPFASWYNGTLTIPRGELFSGSDMGYNAIYEYEDKLLLENGVLKSQYRISNMSYIERIKLDNELYSKIPELKDTLLVYLKNLDWEKLDNSNCECWDSYILTYTKEGKINDVELIKFRDDSTTLGEKIYDWRFDLKCSRKIKSALKPLSLSYVNSHRDFKIEIELFYGEELEIWECNLYFRRLSQKEIEDYVRRQMDIRE